MTGWLSRPAVLWALYEAEGVPAHLVSTLIAVAVYTDSGGKGAYISASTVAALTRKTERQAKRDLRELEEKKLLRRGNQRIVAHIRADRRPVVYDLPMPARGDADVPPSRNGVTHRAQRGDIQVPSGVSYMSPEESFKDSGTGVPPARDAGAGDGTHQTQTPPSLRRPAPEHLNDLLAPFRRRVTP